MKIDARIKILYLIAVSLLAFALGEVYAYALLALQVVVWLAAGVPLKEARYLRKTVTFILVVVFFYAFFTGSRDFILLAIRHYDIKISLPGLYEGVRMSLRFVTVLLSSIIVRSVTGRDEFIRGLIGLRLPKNTAILFDSTLAHLEGKDSPGPGRGRREKGKGLGIKRLLKGDFSIMLELINIPMATARERIADSDLAVIFGLTIVVVSIRFIKVVAGFPLAPGHKNLIIVPCFILAASLTRNRYAATQIGFVSGVVNFLTGFGRFGVFDIFQATTPALAVDLLVRLTRRSQSLFVYAFIGLVAGLARVTTVLVLSFLFRMPREFYVALVPLAFSQCVFGALSAPISRYLVKNVKI